MPSTANQKPAADAIAARPRSSGVTPYPAGGGADAGIVGSSQPPPGSFLAELPHTAAAGGPPERAASAAQGFTCCGCEVLAAEVSELTSREPAARIPSRDFTRGSVIPRFWLRPTIK